jgi:hypothetical protein
MILTDVTAETSVKQSERDTEPTFFVRLRN